MYYQRKRFSNAVRTLVFINVIIFLIQNIVAMSSQIPFSLEKNFALDYLSVVYEYKFWQLFTYMFLHANWWHLLFNMLALYFIGSDVEREWGTKSFVQYYLATGLGAGLFIFLSDSIQILINSNSIPYLGYTLGASGAIFGLILAFSILFRDREITLLLFFIIPVTIKGRNLLIISLFLTVFFPLLFGSGIRISHTGHIGGALSGLIFLILFRKHRSFVDAYYSLSQWWLYIRSSFKKTQRNREFFNNMQFHSKRVDLDETQMTELEIENKIDELLDIISTKGIRGLSDSEKSFLERVSFMYRHKFPE